VATNALAHSSISVNHAKNIYRRKSLFLCRPWKMFENHKSESFKVISGETNALTYSTKSIYFCLDHRKCLKNQKSNLYEVVSGGNKCTSLLLKKYKMCKKMFKGGSFYFCLNLRKCLKIREGIHLRWYLEAPNALAYSSKSINCAKMCKGGSLYFCLDLGKCLKIRKANHLR